MMYHTALSLLTIEPPLGMDPNAVQMVFSMENSDKWVVLGKWHEYLTARRHPTTAGSKRW